MDAPEIRLSVEGEIFHRVSKARTVISMGFFKLMKNHGMMGWVVLERICLRLGRSQDGRFWEVNTVSEVRGAFQGRLKESPGKESPGSGWLLKNQDIFFHGEVTLRSTDSIQIHMESDMGRSAHTGMSQQRWWVRSNPGFLPKVSVVGKLSVVSHNFLMA